MDIHRKNLVKALLDLDGELKGILLSGMDLEETRKALKLYVNRKEQYWKKETGRIHSLDLIIVRDCISVLRNILFKRNEQMAKFSTLGHLLDIVGKKQPQKDNRGFLLEFIHLIKGLLGQSNIYRETEEGSIRLTGRKAAVYRSGQLDIMAKNVKAAVGRYRSGLEPEVISRRKKMKKKILAHFKASEADWNSYKWHLRHIFKDLESISPLVKLRPQEKEGIRIAAKHRLPFGITPYYLSLFDGAGRYGFDSPIRAQVIPHPDEARALAQGREHDVHSLDFMLESDTSPEDLITRRYPQIAIFKPVNTCPQICAYCQRNWEVDPPMFPGAFYRREKIDRALKWFADHKYMSEILITGGDPLLLADSKMDRILARIAGMKHIQRIRLGTRIPVTLPFRITDAFMNMVEKYHEPGKREIAFVTHFEHVAEITPEALEALVRIRRKGLSIYNQTVYTFYNSKRFENVSLRKLLRLSGIDPYYTFNTKGKEETGAYRVPIARLLQEVKEEARLVPGLDRTDEPVFNIPALGKNYLKAAQHHDIIGFHQDGSRIIEFHPWEKKITLADTYIFKDVPIYHYLTRLKQEGEDIRKYDSIWYYY